MIPRHISIRRLTPEKNKTRLAAGSVLAMLLASYSLKLESRSSEGLPQLLKLTHPSNTRCYNLMQESNYQKYPSNNKKKKKFPTNHSRRYKQWVSLWGQSGWSYATFALLVTMFCTPATTLSSGRVNHGTCQWHCLYNIYLVRCSLLSSKQEVQQKMSPWEGNKMLNIVVFK